MPISYTSGELQFSGVVTNAEFKAATSTAGLSLTSNIYKLEAPIRFLSGCDISSWKNFVIDVNAKKIIANSGVVDTTIQQMTLIDRKGRSVANRFWYTDNGGGYLKFKNSQYISAISGGTLTGSGRLIDIVSVESLENVVIKAHNDALLEPDINFQAEARYKGLNAYRISRFIASANCMLQDPVHFSNSNNGGYIDAQGGASVIMLNWDITRSVNIDFDSYPSSQTAGQNILWLGSSRDRFYRNGVDRNGLYLKTNTHNNTLHYAGGIRWVEYVGGENAKFGYYNDSQVTAVNSDINLSVDTLSSVGFRDIDSEGKIEFVTKEFQWRKTSGFTDYSNHKAVVRKFGKEILTQDISSTVSNVVGTDTSYAPTLLTTLDWVDVSQATIQAYTEADTAKKFAQITHDWAIQQDRADLDFNNNLVSFDGISVINAGDYNVIIDPLAVDTVPFDGTNITIKASSFEGNIETTGIITDNNIDIDGTLTDATWVKSFLQFNNIELDTELRIFRTSDKVEIGTGIESSTSTTEKIKYTHTVDEDVYIVVVSLTKEIFIIEDITLTNKVQTFTLNQRNDRYYYNP